MGKTRTKSRSSGMKDILHGTTAPVKSSGRSKLQTKSTEELLTEAGTLLEQSQPEIALPLIDEALRRLEAEREHYATLDTMLKHAAQGLPTYPEALVVAAQVYLSLGDADLARNMFARSVSVDPDGAIISAEPWLELAQLCEEGGHQSIKYIEKATEVLKNEIELLEEGVDEMQGEERLQSQLLVDEKKMKLAEALCAMAEVYMTDLSWEDDVEPRCEVYVTEAIAICPDHLSAGTLQTLASVRISQERWDEAKQALARSMMIWKDLPADVEDAAKPDFPTRVSLVRLLMNVEVELDAMFVVEGLVKEDDQSVESLYLGGWCQFVLSTKCTVAEEKHKYQEQARLWLGNCLKLHKVQQHEDDRLQEHALELINHLNLELGIAPDDDEWEDEDGDGEDDDEDEDELDIEVEADDPKDVNGGDVEMT